MFPGTDTYRYHLPNHLCVQPGSADTHKHFLYNGMKVQKHSNNSFVSNSSDTTLPCSQITALKQYHF